jgi:AGZA family xanthine/uracil permease-like MFS transporter
MSFTYNLGFGMVAGFALYPIFKLFSGRSRDLTVGTWVLFGIAILLFIFYPYERM